MNLGLSLALSGARAVAAAEEPDPFGEELLPDGAFADQADIDEWGTGNSPTITLLEPGLVQIARGVGNNGQMRKSLTLEVGVTYRVTVASITNGTVGAGVGTVRVGTAAGSTAQGTITEAGFLDFEATQTTHWITPNVSGAVAGDAASFGVISVKEIL